MASMDDYPNQKPLMQTGSDPRRFYIDKTFTVIASTDGGYTLHQDMGLTLGFNKSFSTYTEMVNFLATQSHSKSRPNYDLTGITPGGYKMVDPNWDIHPEE